MHRRLLVAGVDEAEILIGHHVQHRQHVVAGQGKDVIDALQLESAGNKVASGNSGHCFLLQNDGVGYLALIMVGPGRRVKFGPFDLNRDGQDLRDLSP